MSTPAVSRLSGTGYNQVQIPTKSAEQMNIFRQLAGGSGGNISSILQQLQGLSGGGNEEYWNQLEAPALRQFGQLQGDIASRFSGAGTGARRSSGFQNAMRGASTDLVERLQAQRLGLQGQARNQLLDLYRQLLGQDLTDTHLMKKKPSLLSSIGSGALSGASSGALFGSALPGIGTGLGAGLGGLLGGVAGFFGRD